MAAVCDLCQQPVPADQLIALGGKNVCARCKPDAVMNLKSGVGMEPRISPEKAEEIRKRIRNLNLVSFAFGVPGIFMVGGAQGLKGDPGIFALVWVAGILLFTIGMVFYARMKGRGGAFGLFGLLSCLGLLILHFFPKACHNCRKHASYRVKECASCGAPM